MCQLSIRTVRTCNMTRASRVACTSESPLSSVQKTSVSRTVKLSGTCHSVMSVVAVRGEWIINQPCLSSASADRDGQYHTQQMSLVQMDRSPPDCISQHFSQHLRGKTFWEIRSLCNITPETNAIHQHLPRAHSLMETRTDKLAQIFQI